MTTPADDIHAPIPVQNNPYNAETPMRLLAEARTPTAAFYVRNHYGMPRISGEGYRLRVEGLVKKPLEFSLDEIQEFPRQRAVITMECAGNGRSALNPRPSGVAWRFGATGTAEFVGTPLRGVLERAGIAADAVEVVLSGVDAGIVNGKSVVAYERSLSLAHAMSGDVLLAWEMNGRPLTVAHGFPVRAVVPRWYAMSSVKWLTWIEVIGEPFAGHWQAAQYLYVGENGTPERTPVTRMRVRSVIGRPAAGECLARGAIEIAGSAWSGEGGISRVEVSTDGGATWGVATLEHPGGPWSATPWRFAWTPPRSGHFVLMSRATDEAGNTQPNAPRHNAMGYGNNGVQHVEIIVKE